MRFWHMNISSPTRPIKLAAVAALLAGCAAVSAEAPFPARPDTTEPGDLRGPFDGRVLDVDTGKPIEGATVVGSWAYESGRALSGPSAAASAVAETDSDGRYALPRAPDTGDSRDRLARFTLVVYKRGWIAYRSDRRFDDLSARHDFAQSGNEVRLERMAADASHAKHLRFIGAGGPLLAKLGWELQQAAQEGRPAEAPTPEKPAPPLDASVLLSADELKAVTRYPGGFTVEKLTDLPSTPSYDSVHFRAEAHPEKYDAALRVWKLAPADAEKQYETELKDLPHATEKNEVGDRSLRAAEGDALAVAALDRASGVVLVFTCGVGQCGDADTVAALVKRMWPRLGRLKPAEPEGPLKLRAPVLK